MDIQKFVNDLNIDSNDEKYCKASAGGNNRARGAFLRKILTKEVLSDFVVTQKLPSNYIKQQLEKKISIGVAAIIKICKEHNIPTSGIKEQNSRKDIQARRQSTFLNRYGSEFPLSKESPFFKIRNDTVKSKYGVKNVFQLESVKEKSMNSLLAKYGVSNSCFIEGINRNNGSFSFQHKMVEDFLNEIEIKFQSEYGREGTPFRKFNQFLNREYSPIVDIHIFDKKLIIEIYGDYWHANPSKYKDDEWIETWKGNLQAKDIREFDRVRKEQLESFGYSVLEIWGSDVMKNFDEVKKKIQSHISN